MYTVVGIYWVYPLLQDSLGPWGLKRSILRVPSHFPYWKIVSRKQSHIPHWEQGKSSSSKRATLKVDLDLFQGG